MTDDCMTIGRSPDNLIRLDDTSVSKHHAMITLEGDDYKLWDLHSTNGSHVNGKRIVVAHLKNSDEVRFGDVVLRFERAEKKQTQPLDARIAEQPKPQPAPAAPAPTPTPPPTPPPQPVAPAPAAAPSPATPPSAPPAVLPEPVPEIVKPHPVVTHKPAPAVIVPPAEPKPKPPEPPKSETKPEIQMPATVAPAAPATKAEPTRVPAPQPVLSPPPPASRGGFFSRISSGWRSKPPEGPPTGPAPVVKPLAPSPASLLGASEPVSPAKPIESKSPAMVKPEVRLAAAPAPVERELKKPVMPPPPAAKPIDLPAKKAIQTPQTEWMTVVPPMMPPKANDSEPPPVAPAPRPRKMPYLIILVIGGAIFMVGYALDSRPLNFVGLVMGAFGLVALFVAPQPLPKRR